MRHPKISAKSTSIMSANALYTDLSSYYDLMCVDIDYEAQSTCIRRLQQMYGNGGKSHLDLACGTGPHVRHFTDFGYQSVGLDINQAMLDIAINRYPEAQFSLQDMSTFSVSDPVDLITCFLYSIHYNASIEKWKECIASVLRALNPGGVFCFNAVNKEQIDNSSFTRHATRHEGSDFTFRSAWNYSGKGEKKSLLLRIEKTSGNETQSWNDEHAMVALSFAELLETLQPYFEVHVFEHDYEKITPWDAISGNAIFICVKK